MAKGNWQEFENPLSQDQPSSFSNVENKCNSRFYVETTKAGKKGKTVTVVRGLSLEAEEFKLLLKKLKNHCGTGGTLKEGTLELQGDHIESVLKFLEDKSFN